MAKGVLDVHVDQMMLDKDMDHLTSKLQKKLLLRRHSKCQYCSGVGTFQPIRLPSNMDKLQVYLSWEGIIACHEIRCHHCDHVETVTSSEIHHSEVDKRLKLNEHETEFFSAKIEHHEIIHDLLELLHIAAISDPDKRNSRHAELTSFVMKRVKAICEEWCRPENRDLRYKKFLVMYHETVFKCDDKPDLSSAFSDEYKEIYQMLRSSFYSNKTHVELLLCLMKETLFDCPNTAGFMMWVKIAMMHTDQLEEFASRHYKYANMNIKSYDHLLDTFMALEIPVGLKKIPVVFMLFELPRFYHYIELFNRRCGPSTKFCSLTEDEYRFIGELEVHMKMLKEKESGGKRREPTKEKFRKILKNHSKQKAKEDTNHAPKIKSNNSTKNGKETLSDTESMTSLPKVDLPKDRSDLPKAKLDPPASDMQQTDPTTADLQTDTPTADPPTAKLQSDTPTADLQTDTPTADPSTAKLQSVLSTADPPTGDSSLADTFKFHLDSDEFDSADAQSDLPKVQSDLPKAHPEAQPDPPKIDPPKPQPEVDPPKPQPEVDPPKPQPEVDPPKAQPDSPKAHKFTTHSGKLKDLDITIQSSSIVPPASSSSCIREPLTDSSDESADGKDKELSKCINSSKVKEIDPENGILKVYDQVTFKFTDNDGIERETVLMQTEPKVSKIIGYSKDTFRLADLAMYELEPMPDYTPRKPFTSGSFTIEIGKGNSSSTPSSAPTTAARTTTLEDLPSEIRSLLKPLRLQDSLSSDQKDKPSTEIRKEVVEEIETDFPSTSTKSMEEESMESDEKQQISTDDEDNKMSELEQDDKPSSEAKDDMAALCSLLKPKSKKPHYKYGTKWRKNKTTYNVDEVSDTDSDKEEEYTYYPCKLLSEYVETQNIVETASSDLHSDVITLTDFLDSHNIHHSLWTIKKKYIQNELFVILDMARDSDRDRLPLVSASNNRGISVPVLPILNLSSDSSALDHTIGSLYGIQVSHKLSKKQKNVFQRYIRIAVARARHSELFDKVSLGAIKYVKTNDKRVEVKLSVKDMQYEAKNEEESERRKIIRLLKRAGAEQDVKKKEPKGSKQQVSQPEPTVESRNGLPNHHNSATSLESIKHHPEVYREPPMNKDGSFMEKKITLKVDKRGKIKGNKPEKKLQKASKNALQFGKNELMSSKQFKSSLTAARNLGCDISVEYVIERDDSHTGGTTTAHKKVPEHKKKRENVKVEKPKTLPKEEEVSTPKEIPPEKPVITTDDAKQAKVTFRDKFNSCSYCNQSISERIRICSGCRKVAYCDSKCQKSHWKVHKKKCFYALSKDMKETTG